MIDVFKALKNLVIKYRHYLIGTLVILMLIISTVYFAKSYYTQVKINKHNIEALTDTITYYQTKNGKLVAEKNILIGDMSDLKIANEDLYNKVKSMKVSNPQNVVYIKSTVENEKHDTMWTVKIKRDTIYGKPFIDKKEFAFNNKYRELEGQVSLFDTTMTMSINKDKIYLDYTLAIKDGKVYIQSDNPYVKYNEIQGLSIDGFKYKRQKRFGIGPSIGYGYDFINNKFSPYIGISLNYNLICF